MRTDKRDTGGDPSERPLATLVGDRLCLGCGYNLVGQPVMREPSYSMLIVRCPECGTVASVQEYPLLSRWAGRWATMLAAAWFATCIILVVASAGLMASMAKGIATQASQKHAAWLSNQQKQWLLEQQRRSNALPPNSEWLLTQPDGSVTMAESTWLLNHDLDELLAEAGGWRKAADARAIWGWTSVAVWSFVIGVLWSVALIHLRRPWLLLFGGVLLGVASLGFLFDLSPLAIMSFLPGTWMSMLELARRQIGPVFQGLTLAFAALPLAAGLLLGRHVVRGFVRALLPPRMRGSLAGLWLADGKPPPTVGRRRR